MMVQQNVYHILQNRKYGMDMQDLAKSVRYGASQLNIALPQIQLPLQHEVDLRYLEKIQKKHLSDPKCFIGFNSLSKLHESRSPLRHTYILRGTNRLIGSSENPRVFKEQYEQFVFQNTKYERGFQTILLKDPHYLPIPYPRYFTDLSVTSDGFLTPKGTTKPEFLQ